MSQKAKADLLRFADFKGFIKLFPKEGAIIEIVKVFQEALRENKAHYRKFHVLVRWIDPYPIDNHTPGPQFSAWMNWITIKTDPRLPHPGSICWMIHDTSFEREDKYLLRPVSPFRVLQKRKELGK